MNFSNNFKELRLTTQTSQKTLSDLLGVSVRSIQRYEKGDREPTLEQVIILADFFGVSVDKLIR